MSDLHQKATGQRNMLQDLMAKIPGFKGYQEREQRREVDKIQRDFCAEKLYAQKGKIQSVLDDVISGGDLDGIQPFEKLLNRIDAVASVIKNAPRGYAGIFDAIKVEEQQLTQVYEFDCKLMDGCEEVGLKVDQMAAGDKEKRLALVKEAIAMMDRLNESFSMREELLRKG